MFGFFSEYNYLSARIATNRGQFSKVCINYSPARIMVEKVIGRKYGIKINTINNRNDCLPVNYWGILKFNKCMNDSYIKKFGIKIYEKYQHELDSAHRLIYDM